MPNNSAIEAGRAFLKLVVDDKEFAGGLDNSLRKLNSFGDSALKVGASLGAVGAAMAAPFAASVKVFVDVGDELYTLSQRTGISVRSLSELKYAAEQSGASLETIARAAVAMQRQGLDPRTFDSVAASIAAIQEPTERAQAAFKAFGKSGVELLPMLDELSKLRAEARDLGLAMDPEAAKRADALDDAFNALKLQSQALASAIGAAVAPAVQSAAEAMGNANKTLIDFVGNHRGLTAVLAAVAVGVNAVGGALAFLGSAARGASAALTLLRHSLSLLSRHPYLIVGTLLATLLGGLILKFTDLGGVVDDTNASVETQIGLQQDLATAFDAGTDEIDARTEALKRLQQRKDDAAKPQREREIEGEIRREEKLRSLRQELGEASGDYNHMFGPFATHEERRSPGARRSEARIDELENEISQIESAPVERFIPQPRSALGSPHTKFKFGPTAIIQVLPDLPRVGKGKPGFESVPQIQGSIQREFGPRGTFSGNLASQIFGGSGGLSQIAQRALKEHEKLRQVVERMERQGRTIGPSYRVGNV